MWFFMIKKFINLQLVKFKKTAILSSVFLLLLNLTFTIYPYIERYTFEFMWIDIPLIFLGISFIGWICVHIYTRVIEMWKTEHMAELLYNPYAVQNIAPFEEMTYRTIWIPLLKGIMSTTKDEKIQDLLFEKINFLESWVNLGYIPKAHMPEHLRKLVITKKEERLE